MRYVRTLAVVLLVVVAIAPARASDQCATATPIASLPFSTTVDTTTATSDPGDPGSSCSSSGDNTVWFTYTASRPVTLLFDTLGSDYPAAISVYTDGCAATAEIACAADDDFDDRTQLAVPVAAGATIHVFVESDVFGGGSLH